MLETNKNLTKGTKMKQQKIKTKELVESADSVIAAGLMRKPKRVWSKCVEGGCDDEAL